MRSPAPFAAALLLAAAPALADDATDRLNRAVEALAAQPGYALAANWQMDVEKIKPVKGTVESVVRHKDDFLKLHAVFEDGEVTVYQKGAQIAGQDPQTKEWGSLAEDARAKFVLKMFNLKSFLSEAAGMAKNARLAKGEREEWLRVEFEADAEKLKKLLGDAAAGKALTNGTLENATMKVAVEVDRKSGVPQRVSVDIEGDSKHPPRKQAGNGNNGGWEDWSDPKTDEHGNPLPKNEEPKKEDPKPETPPEPIVEHLKVHLDATPNYNAPLDAAVPDAVRKVLGL
ncbi:MAG: hypothetical protein IT452_08775 [Planctomycetia bacterium]|nr:hypothetical protein [Planctomycetia bacterium]